MQGGNRQDRIERALRAIQKMYKITTDQEKRHRLLTIERQLYQMLLDLDKELGREQWDG